MSTTFNINLFKPVKDVKRLALENVASRLVGAVLPPYWYKKPVTIQGKQSGFDENYPVNISERPDGFSDIENFSDAELKQIVANALGVPMFLPVWIAYESEKDTAWLLPVEPLLSLTGQNIIIRRNVAKADPERQRRGTVKERWATDDYTIKLDGVLFDFENENRYPANDVARLREYCEAREALYIKNDLLQIFGIDRFVIESFDFPYTKGENTQSYSITGYSDDIFSLLIDEKGLL